MADDNRSQGSHEGAGSTITDLAHAITDPINRFGEGIAQTVYKVLADRTLPELLVIMAGGTLCVNAVITMFRNALRDDPEGLATAEDMLRRQNFLDHLEKTIKNVIEWHQKRVKADQQKAKEPMQGAVTSLVDSGFPGLAALFADLGKLAGIEGVTVTGTPTAPAPAAPVSPNPPAAPVPAIS